MPKSSYSFGKGMIRCVMCLISFEFHKRNPVLKICLKLGFLGLSVFLPRFLYHCTILSGATAPAVPFEFIQFMQFVHYWATCTLYKKELLWGILRLPYSHFTLPVAPAILKKFLRDIFKEFGKTVGNTS